MAQAYHLIFSTDQKKYLRTDVRKKGGRYICTPVQEFERLESIALKKPLRLSFASSQTLILLEEFPPLAHKLLLMHVEKQLENRALMDEGVKSAISYRIIDSKGKKRLHSLVVLPRNDVWPAIEYFAGRRTFIHTATPSVAALGALTARLTPEPLIVIMARENSSELIAFREGIPLYMQSFPMTGPGEFDITMVSHAVTVCRQALFRDFQIEKLQILLLGEKRNNIDISDIEEEKLEPDWQSLPITANPQSIRSWPELYGTLFIRRNYSYLPREYLLSHKLKKVNSWITAVCALATLGLSALAWNTWQHNSTIKHQLTKGQTELEKRIGTLQNVLPPSDNLKHLEHYLDILARGVLEPRLSTLLETLALAIPETVRIEKLTVKKASPLLPDSTKAKMDITSLPPPGNAPNNRQKTITSGLQTPENNQQKPIVLDVTFASEGAYRNVRAAFETTVKNLSETFDLKDIEWGYGELEESGYLKGQLWVLKEEK
jgi:hypothetical protein